MTSEKKLSFEVDGLLNATYNKPFLNSKKIEKSVVEPAQNGLAKPLEGSPLSFY